MRNEQHGNRPPRVTISNVYSDDNRGGAAITSATIETVRRAVPGCAVTLIAVDAKRAGIETAFRHTLRDHPDVDIVAGTMRVRPGPLRGAREVLRSLLLLAGVVRSADEPFLQRLRASDLVVGKGGQLFSVRRRVAGLGGFWMSVFPLLYARRCGTPTALYSVTIGPYPEGDLSGRLAGWTLRRVDLILPRDADSAAEALRLGVAPSRLHEIPDCVTTMDPPPPGLANEVARRCGLDGTRFAAVTMNRPGRGTGLHVYEFVKQIVRPLLDRGVIDRVAVVVQSDGARKSDHAASEGLVAAFDDARVVLVREDLSAVELAALYSAASFTLGGRIHSAILSLIGGAPAFPLLRPGAHKARSIFEAFGLGRYVVHYGEEPGHWAEVISATVQRGEEARRELRDTVARLRRIGREEVPPVLRGVISGTDAAAPADAALDGV